MQDVAQILGYIGVGSACLPISFCVLFISDSFKYIHWSLLILSLAYFLINIISLFLFLDKNFIQEYLFNVYFIIELVLLSLFFLKNIRSIIFFRLSILGLIVFYILASGLYYFGSLSVSSSFSLFSNIFLIIYSVYIVISEYFNSVSEKLTNNGDFLIATSVMFYAGVQFYFSLFDIMIREDSKQIFYYLWPILQVGGIIYYISFTYGLWKLAKS